MSTRSDQLWIWDYGMWGEDDTSTMKGTQQGVMEYHLYLTKHKLDENSYELMKWT